MRYLRVAAVVTVTLGVVLAMHCNLFGKAKSKWTVIAYYDGNNSLDTVQHASSWVISEAMEAEKVGSTDQVQYLAMVGSLKSGGQCRYYHIEKQPDESSDSLRSTVLSQLGSKDMSDKATMNWPVGTSPRLNRC